MSVADNLEKIRAQITAAALRAGRDPDGVRLVAVSKTQPAGLIREAFQAGQTLFGENYVQELLSKAEEIREPAEWHFIGSLQSNKVRLIAGKVSFIHSVDRFSLAEEISRQWAKLGQTADILLQVNISRETTKGGTTAEELSELAAAVARLPNLRVKGLMTMPPFFDDPEGARPFFRELRRLSEVLVERELPGVAMEELSMGMSGDFEVAVEEGATLVRVGSAIFGERTYR